jgi:TPR repeat protein
VVCPLLIGSEYWIQQAEAAFDDSDLSMCVELWSAYSSGLGSGTQQSKDAKALALITKLAELGNVRAQEVLMCDCLHGTNGVLQDLEKFRYWANLAAQGGSSLARDLISSSRREVE